jgi:hypothetical protein
LSNTRRHAARGSWPCSCWLVAARWSRPYIVVQSRIDSNCDDPDPVPSSENSTEVEPLPTDDPGLPVVLLAHASAWKRLDPDAS